MTKKILLILILYSLSIYSQDIQIQNQILNAKKQVLPALVHIQPVKEIFSSGKRVKIKVTGSGVIFSRDGYILTNNHVAEKAKYVVCTLYNKEEINAEVVGLDPLTDLAVLKLNMKEIENKNFAVAEFGDSDQLEVGQLVMALGSPLGLSKSLSLGVISSLDRYFEDRGDMVSPFNLWIQTDAAINPGNSGGPLVNMDGKVIGINARGITFGENLGFAIPVNTAKLVIDRILNEKEVKRSYIGIELQEIKELKKYNDNKNLNGVLIAHVDEGSPAEQYGLKPGDIIQSVDDYVTHADYVEELPKIRKFIAEIPVGKEIDVTYLRDSETYTKTLKTKARGKFEGNEFECEEWGLAVQEITPRIAKNLNLEDESGVLISGVRRGSLADDADVFRGYVIKYIDKTEIKDLEQFKKLYEELKELPEKGRMLKTEFGKSTHFALLKE